MQLAQINIGRLRHPIHDPRIADFVDNLDRVNTIAERSPGFVWRMKDDTGNATQMALYDDPRMIANMSVWESVEALHGFAYQTIHRRFVQRRKEWFEPFGAACMALWWIEAGTIPEIGEAAADLPISIALGRPSTPSASPNPSRRWPALRRSAMPAMAARCPSGCAPAAEA
jgi:hypothetical protein